MSERHKIARGRITDVKRTQRALIAIIMIWLALMGAALALLPGKAGQLAASASVVLLMLPVIGFVVFLKLSGHVDIGSDGVYVDSRDDKRFIPFSEMEAIRAYDKRVDMNKSLVGVSLYLSNDERYVLSTGQDHAGAVDRASKLQRAIENAFAAYQERREDMQRAPAAMRRGDRETGAWIDRLRGVREGVAAHRDAPVPLDDLWRIVECPVAPAVDRASAATALGARLDDAGKDRLRVAIDDTAAPKLRVALACAIDDDEAALAEALDDLAAS